jgi:hypothetical protein
MRDYKSNGYVGFDLSPMSADDAPGELQQPGYYQMGKDLQAYGQGPYGALMPGGLVAGLIGGAMTGPYNRQNAFLGEMRSAGLLPQGPQGQPQAPRATTLTGRLAGAVNMGNGLIGLPNGDVMDHTGTVVGGAWQGVVDRTGGPIGWGVGVSPNRSTMPNTPPPGTPAPDGGGGKGAPANDGGSPNKDSSTNDGYGGWGTGNRFA